MTLLALPLLAWSLAATAADGGAAAASANTASAPAKANAELDNRTVKRQMRADARTCYSPYVKAHPRPPGNINIVVSVIEAGTTENITVKGLDQVADECLRAKAASWKFANPTQLRLKVALDVPAAEIDPESTPISAVEVKPLLTLLEGKGALGEVLEPLDDDGLDQLRARLCLPGDPKAVNSLDEACSQLARALEQDHWTVKITKSPGDADSPRMLQANQKGYQLGGRVSKWSGAQTKCRGFDASLSIRSPHHVKQ
jgi:hypothetical protein